MAISKFNKPVNRALLLEYLKYCDKKPSDWLDAHGPSIWGTDITDLIKFTKSGKDFKLIPEDSLEILEIITEGRFYNSWVARTLRDTSKNLKSSYNGGPTDYLIVGNSKPGNPSKRK
jgi:hypothetical protein